MALMLMVPMSICYGVLSVGVENDVTIGSNGWTLV